MEGAVPDEPSNNRRRQHRFQIDDITVVVSDPDRLRQLVKAFASGATIEEGKANLRRAILDVETASVQSS